MDLAERNKQINACKSELTTAAKERSIINGQMLQSENALKKLIKNYDEAASRVQAQEYANRRLVLENDNLQKAVQRLQKN